jgi:hypothetical protein
MDYAKHTDGKGRIRDVDEFIADQNAARRAGQRNTRIDDSGLSAETVYRSRRKDVDALLDWLHLEVEQHAAFTEKEGVDFGHCGDLGHMRQLLVEALAFLAQQEPEDVERRLNEGR